MLKNWFQLAIKQNAILGIRKEQESINYRLRDARVKTISGKKDYFFFADREK